MAWFSKFGESREDRVALGSRLLELKQKLASRDAELVAARAEVAHRDEAADLKLVDVMMNNINGGSFAGTATRKDSSAIRPNNAVINWLLEQEERLGINTPKPYRDFEERVYRHRDDLVRLFRALRADSKTVLGYGASTKGNVVLQFCGFTTDDIPAIAEVNPEKFGRVTPGTHIPIISEAEAHAIKPDYYLVLLWHFKEGIRRREKEYLNAGGKFIIPFPEIEII